MIGHWLAHWLGLDNPSGPVYLAWSGVVGTSVIGGVGTVLRRLLKRHHAEVLAQAALHHRERLAQAADHHNAHLDLLRRHHQQQLDAREAPEIVVTPAMPASKPGTVDGAAVAKALKDHLRKGGGM